MILSKITMMNMSNELSNKLVLKPIRCVIDPTGTITYTLRPDGQPSSIEAPGNITTGFGYDSYGRQTSISMKKNHIATIFRLMIISSFSIIVSAQDLIKTYNEEELNCQITRVRKGNIYFLHNNQDQVLSLKDVAYYVYDYDDNSKSYYKAEKPASKMRIALKGGWSYRPVKINKNVSQHLVPYKKELKSGYGLGMNTTYYFKETIGTGIIFNYFNSKNEIGLEIPTIVGYSTIYIRDNISIYFIGQTIDTRLLTKNKRNNFVFNAGFGYLGYYNQAQNGSHRFIIKNGTIGAVWDVGYDIGLSKNFALGIQVTYIAGFLTSYKVTYGILIQDDTYGLYSEKIKLKKDDYENLSTLSLSVGLRFNLGKIR